MTRGLAHVQTSHVRQLRMRGRVFYESQVESSSLRRLGPTWWLIRLVSPLCIYGDVTAHVPINVFYEKEQ